MDRIILHWTAGKYTASGLDREHYHYLIESDGEIVAGKFPVAANKTLIPGHYAAHTLNCNRNAIGVSMCAMFNATPENFGEFPYTKLQWSSMVDLVARLCVAYKIPVTRMTVLSHAEVEPTLQIKQRGKWDITVIPWNSAIKGPVAVGDMFRLEVAAILAARQVRSFDTSSEPRKSAVSVGPFAAKERPSFFRWLFSTVKGGKK